MYDYFFVKVDILCLFRLKAFRKAGNGAHKIRNFVSMFETEKNACKIQHCMRRGGENILFKEDILSSFAKVFRISLFCRYKIPYSLDMKYVNIQPNM